MKTDYYYDMTYKFDRVVVNRYGKHKVSPKKKIG